MSRPRGGASWWRPVLVIVVPVLISTAAAVAVLIRALAPGTAQERLDAIRTGLAIGAGVGAVITLALALRRQQATEHDATERRLTELYVKAFDQLGSDKAAVRHGGLYALERVAQDNPAHRQTIVDVICAYLRSPYTAPREPDAGKLGVLRERLRSLRARLQPPRRCAPASTPNAADQETHQEREVRLTAQRILHNHLQPRTPARNRWFSRPVRTFWPDIDLDLTGATLIDFDFRGAAVRTARFTNARFIDIERLTKAEFHGETWSLGTHFEGARFDGVAWFEGANFECDTSFNGAQFRNFAMFIGARFDHDVQWVNVRFGEDASFMAAEFNGVAWFSAVWFNGVAWFNGARFGNVQFDKAQFSRDASLDGAEFRGKVPDELKPHLPSD